MGLEAGFGRTCPLALFFRTHPMQNSECIDHGLDRSLVAPGAAKEWGLGFLTQDDLDFLLNYGIGVSYAKIHLDPVLGSILMGVIIFTFKDFCDFFNHYLQHKVKWMWYFHMSHHRATALTPLTKYRLHPGEYLQNSLIPLLIEVPGVIFIYSLFKVHGEDTTYTAVIFITLGVHYIFMHLRHSPIPIHYGFLNHMFMSPLMHQIHHSSAPEHHDKNFGISLTIWDRMFNTLHLPKGDEKLEFGLDKNEHEALTFWGELKHPFTLIYKEVKVMLSKVKIKGFSEAVNLENLNKKNSGYSFIETMITTVVSSFLFLAGASLILTIVYLKGAQEKINASETELEKFIGIMKTVSSQAVNVRYRNGNLNGMSSPPTGEGFVRQFNYTNHASMGARPSETLMFFAKETTKSTVTNPAGQFSRFRPTGVFFVKKDEATRQGSRIIIDLGANNANGIVAPDGGGSDIIVNNVSDLVIDQPQFSTGRVLQSVRVTIKMIYSILGSDTSKTLDCLGPSGDVANGTICDTQAFKPFNIVEKSFVLRFFNNKRDIVLPDAEFEFGFYFFPVYRALNP